MGLYSGYMCDKCGNSVSYGTAGVTEFLPGKSSLIALARRDGWTVGKQVLCPTCKRKKK